MDTKTNTLPPVAAPEAPAAAPGLAELLSVRDVAALLGLGASTVRAHDRNGRLPAPVRLGGSVRWVRRELLAWLDAGCPVRARWELRGKRPAERIRATGA